MPLTIEDITTFCKRKGFVFLDSEIYGGLAGFWDYGPLGVELKNSIKQHWWKIFVQQRDDVVGIDGTIITNPGVWEASGHVDSFVDVFLECKKCKFRIRADSLIEDELHIKAEGLSAKDVDKIVKENKLVCPKCGAGFEKAQKFNLMFETKIGSTKQAMVSYLRPETAQSIFTNFKLVAETSRLKLPFGIAQIGKAYRNEISPRNFLFRTREFEQMEIEYFVNPDNVDECPLFKDVAKIKVNMLTATMQEKKKNKHKEMTIKDTVDKKIMSPWQAYWTALEYKWFLDLGIKKENIRLREHLQEELAHYAGACVDIDYNFPFGWKEIYGNADRKQFDLQQHSKFSKKDLSIYDEEKKQKITPYVASEPSQGVDRAFLAFLIDAYNDDKKRGNIVLKLHPAIAPVKFAILPLVSNKPQLVKFAMGVYDSLKNYYNCSFDKSGSIGRRYARNDEIGTPFCITIDFDSLKKKDVTIRDRDTTKQARIKIKDLPGAVCKLLSGENLQKVGKLV